MKNRLSESALQQLFTEARSYRFWDSKGVSDETLQELYGLMKWGPTSVNAMPARIFFLKSAEGKEKLIPALMGMNIDQVKSAPVTAIIAYDLRFYDHLQKLYPAYDAKPLFENDAKLSFETAFRNSSLQGAYLILAARSLGLDVNPMSGFDNKLVDEAYFANTNYRSNFICTIGYGDDAKLYPRGPRLEFDEACKIL